MTEAVAEADARLPRGSFVTGIATVLLSNGIYLVGGFAANVLTANLLSPTDFGYFAIAMAVMIVVQEVCGTGFDLAMVRLASPLATHERDAVIRVSLRIKMIANGSAALALFVLSGSIATGLFGSDRLTAPLRWASAGVVGTALFQHLLARFQLSQRFKTYAALKSSNSLLKVALLVCLGFAAAASLQAVMAASVLVLFVSSVIALAAWDRNSNGAADPIAQAPAAHLSRQVLWFGRWMIVAHLLFAIYGRIDVLLLGWLQGEEHVGYYNVAWNLGFLMDMCTYSVITALLPHASRMTSKDEFQAYRSRTLRVCAILGILMLPSLVLVRPAINLLFPAYPAAVEIFRVLFWGCLATLLSHPLYLIVYARDRVEMVALSNLILAAVATGACWVLIPRFGAIGAAYGTVIARVINAGLVVYLANVELKRPIAVS
ncbi:MAG TPA: oligosaccharide flippase family protein [Vicinamibacterales bacterium]|nr:oligosaccharide flippase family protein [Vicinamibacterales bacterium]